MVAARMNATTRARDGASPVADLTDAQKRAIASLDITDRVTLTISRDTLETAIACIEAIAEDPREPERYRDWYRPARDELRDALDKVSQSEPI